MSFRSLGVRDGYRSEDSTSLPRLQSRCDLQSANTGATRRSSGNMVACTVLYQYLKAKQQARAAGVCLSRVPQPMERICDGRSLSSPAFNVSKDDECRAIPAKRRHEVVSMAPVSYQRNTCRGPPSSTACYEEMQGCDMQPSVEALKLYGRTQPAVIVTAAQEYHTSGNVSTVATRTVPRSERIRLLSRYRRCHSPDRHTGGGDATSGDRCAISDTAGTSESTSTCLPADGKMIVSRVRPSGGVNCSAFTVSSAGDHTALADVSAISSADLSDSRISINTSCLSSLATLHTADTPIVSLSGVTRSICDSSAFSSGVAKSGKYIELPPNCSEVPAYPLPPQLSSTLPPEECPGPALRRVHGTLPISSTNETVRNPPETLSATSSTEASMSLFHDILEAHNFAAVGNSTTSCSTMFTGRSDLKRIFQSEQPVKSDDHVSQQSNDRVSQQSSDRVSQQSNDRVSQLSGDRISQQSGDCISQQSFDRISQMSGDCMSQMSGDRISQQSGDRVSQQSGDRVSQQPCDHLSQHSLSGGSEFVNPEGSSALPEDRCGAESALVAVVRSERDALQLELDRLKHVLLETGRHLEVRVQQVARLSQELEAARSAEQLSNGRMRQLEEQLRRSASNVRQLEGYILWLRSSYSRLFGPRVPEMPQLISSSS